MKPTNLKSENESSPELPLSRLPVPLVLTFSPGGEEAVSKAMEEWGQELEKEGAGKIILNLSDKGEQVFRPSLGLQGEATSKIFYHFVPRGPEERAFRELLWRAGHRGTNEKSETGEKEARENPAELILFVDNQCPNCPRAVRTVHTLALEIPLLLVHLFEASLWVELVEKNKIRSVPTLLIGEKLRFVGNLEQEKLSSLLQSEDSNVLLHEQIRQYIQDGKALEAGPMIAAMEDPSFLVQDLEKSTFQDRVGLLLALDEALEARADCLEPMVKGLLPCLDADDPALRGDMADLLGKIGHPDALPSLERLSQDTNPDVAEAAADAVESIREKSQ